MYADFAATPKHFTLNNQHVCLTTSYRNNCMQYNSSKGEIGTSLKLLLTSERTQQQLERGMKAHRGFKQVTKTIKIDPCTII